MRDAELDENRLLAAEVEDALKSLRMAGGAKDDGDLRSAVDDLRRTSKLLRLPPVAIGSRNLVQHEGRRPAKR